MQTAVQRRSMLAGLMIVVGLVPLLWWPSVISRLLPSDIMWRNVASEGLDWIIALTLITLVLLGEKRSLSSLGFKRLTSENFFGGIGAASMGMVAMVILMLFIPRVIPDVRIQTDAAVTGSLPNHFFIWFAPLSLITASVAEEIIFRGYATERLLLLTQKKWVAVLLPNLAFALYHMKDGLQKVVMVAVLGLIFQLVYVKHRDLTMTIVMHAFIDLLALAGHIFNK